MRASVDRTDVTASDDVRDAERLADLHHVSLSAPPLPQAIPGREPFTALGKLSVRAAADDRFADLPGRRHRTHESPSKGSWAENGRVMLHAARSRPTTRSAV